MDFFVDDNKAAEWYPFIRPGSVVVVRTGEAALASIREYLSGTSSSVLGTLYLDHDLGDGISGYQLLLELLENNTPPLRVIIISLNVVGIQRIKALCEDHDIPCRIGGFPNVSIIGKPVS